jgi:hypothetical protein
MCLMPAIEKGNRATLNLETKSNPSHRAFSTTQSLQDALRSASWVLRRAADVFALVECVLHTSACFAVAQNKDVTANLPPNPYRVVENWATLPAGRIWGDVGSVAVDSKDHVWVLDKCGASTCVGSNSDPILEFTSSGKFLKSFGAGLLLFPHSIYVDKSDNVWAVDEQAASEKQLAEFPEARGKGLVVVKFSPESKVLMTLGTPGVAGDPPRAFMRPTSVAIDAKGDIYVSDGHPKDRDSDRTARIVMFSRDAKFVRTWGKRGSSEGEFEYPHSMVFDSWGRLFVADRGNDRVQIFDQDGKFLGQWKQFGNATGIFIDSRNTIYVSDNEYELPEAVSQGFAPGIRIGNPRQGSSG